MPIIESQPIPQTRRYFNTTQRRELAHIARTNQQLGPRTIIVQPGENIQAAIDRLNNAGGGVVFLKQGTHIINADLVLYSNIALEGEGVDVSIIDLNDASGVGVLFEGTSRTIGGNISITEGSTSVTGSGTTFTNAAAGDILLVTTGDSNFWAEISSITTDTALVLRNAWPMPAISSSSSFIIMKALENCRLKNLTIENGNNPSGTASVHIKQAINFTCENVLVQEDSAGEGFQITNVIDATFKNVVSRYNGNDSTDDGFNIGVVRRVRFESCSANGNAGDGFDISLGSEENTFVACVADGNTGVGFDLRTQANLFSCRAGGNDSDGFNISAAKVVLEACLAHDNAGDGIEVSDGSGTVISNCKLILNDAYGINISGTNMEGITLINPYFSGNVSGRISDSNTKTFLANFGFVSKTLANGANNNIGSTNAGLSYLIRFMEIVGPTGAFSISGFADGVNGRLLTIYNTVAQDMTITNDATSTAANRILTLTGADVTLTGVSSATFIYSASSARWILISTSG